MTVSSYNELLSALLNWLKLMYGLFWQSIRHSYTISAQTSPEGIKCTKVKDKQRTYCPKVYNVYNVYRLTRIKVVYLQATAICWALAGSK